MPSSPPLKRRPGFQKLPSVIEVDFDDENNPNFVLETAGVPVNKIMSSIHTSIEDSSLSSKSTHFNTVVDGTSSSSCASGSPRITLTSSPKHNINESRSDASPRGGGGSVVCSRRSSTGSMTMSASSTASFSFLNRLHAQQHQAQQYH